MKTINVIFAVFVYILTIFAFPSVAFSQARFGYPTVEERQLIGTKWRYAYTLHLESNTTIHQADKEYQYFLYLKYDNTYEQFLNGKLTKGAWSLKNNSVLEYPFKTNKQFEIADVSNQTLVLEFKQPNSNGTYQYHFVQVSSKDAPFIRPANELEEVVIEGNSTKKKKRNWFALLFKDESKTRKKEPTNISVELVGGGYYGGIDPVLKDFITIKTDGRLIQEIQTVNQPLRVLKKNIPRAELEQFAEYVVNNKFFDSQRLYDCGTPLCEKRKLDKPTPIPLRLMISYGDKKKVVTISIWGEDKMNTSGQKYIDYPKSLDNIIEAIQKFAHRAEPTASNK